MRRTKDSAYHRADASAFMRQILEATEQQGVIFMDLNGTIRGWNHGATFITGFTPDDMLGQHATRLFTPEDRERKLDEHELQTAILVGAAYDERWHLRKDGSSFFSNGVTIPLKPRRGKINGFLKIFRDMTHLRMRMKSMENALQEHEQQQRQRDTFLGTIAHELRNPLSPLKAAVRVIERSLAAGVSAGHSIQIINRQIAALEGLVEDLVDLTRAKSGKLSIAYERVQMQGLVANAADTCSAAAVKKAIDLHVSVPSVPIELELDSARMHQVLVNLLNNAIKYTPEGGGVSLTATTDQTHAVFFVKDTGIGIGPDLLPKIFDMFTQAPDAKGHRGAGLGIGLALVKQVVELHQGTVEAISEGRDKGSQFIVRIPQRPPHGAESEPMQG
jgi:PAS domain S-box-containing protein